jgi:hypothetical protein
MELKLYDGKGSGVGGERKIWRGRLRNDERVASSISLSKPGQAQAPARIVLESCVTRRSFPENTSFTKAIRAGAALDPAWIKIARRI